MEDFEIIDSIPNRLSENIEFQKMIDYINNAIKKIKNNNMNVVILERKRKEIKLIRILLQFGKKLE